MPTSRTMRAAVGLLAATASLVSLSMAALAQDPSWQQGPYRSQGAADGPYGADPYQGAQGQANGMQGGGGYGAQGYSSPPTYGAAPPYGAPGYNAPAYGGPQPGYNGYNGYANAPVNPGYGTPPGNDAYSPGRSGNQGYGTGPYDAYPPANRYSASPPAQDSFTDPGQPYDGPSDYGANGYDSGGYGAPYAPPPPAPPAAGYDSATPASGQTFEQGEIIAAGHQFFGSISKGLASAVEYAFRSQGRPNGYILGEDAGGAFVLGLRYGEGTLYTKDAGDHRVYWQGPSIGYDAGAEGSKTMVLVYNMRDPSEIYNRFGGVQGSAYLVGGVSVQFQKHNDVTLGIIRSGVGVRLGANVGYLKYTRSPTWNPL